MAASGSSTRQLLTRLRAASAAGRLGLADLPSIIASEVGTDACSIYLADGDGALVLRATTGLRGGAVGITRLRAGEGIVGHVAATGEMVNVASAPSHAAFAFRPETGELAFRSMLAVPIRRAGTVLGVLAVQDEAETVFPDDDEEALATAAMLLAEVLSARPMGAAPNGRSPASRRHFRGVPLSNGIVRGRLLLGPDARKPGLLEASDPEREEERLDRAIARMQDDLDALLRSGRPDADTADAAAARDVLDATRLLTRGAGWIRRVREGLAEGLSVEASIDRVLQGLRRRMRAIADPGLRERLSDLEDIGTNLLTALAEGSADANEPLPRDTVLLVRRLGPAKLLHWHARGIAGLVVEEASPAGHAAILARSLDIPAIGGVAGAVDAAEDGQELILDAGEGNLFLQPDPEIVRIYARQIGGRAALAQERARLAALPDRTVDGLPFSLELNAGLPQEAALLEPTGASGIGLFRTEIFVLARGSLPDEVDQERFYRRVLDRAGQRTVTFRTFDLGGDKMVADGYAVEEANPAMGWRSLRAGLDEKGAFAAQFRALLRAAAGRSIRIMFPMVATVGEFRDAAALLDVERRALGIAVGDVEVGAMLEVPSLLFELPALFREADFVSVGSNDLMQFLFAADRGSARVASRYDLFQPAMLDAIDRVVAAASAPAAARLSLCGEVAGRPLEAATLLALGVGTLSMPPVSLSRVKAALVETDLGRLRDRLAMARVDGACARDLRRVVAESLPAGHGAA